jgi:hypothetical protein
MYSRFVIDRSWVQSRLQIFTLESALFSCSIRFSRKVVQGWCKFGPKRISSVAKKCSFARIPNAHARISVTTERSLPTLRTTHDANHPVNPPLALGQRAPRIYQDGTLGCAGCGGTKTLAHHTGPGEPADVNTLLENIELLQNHGILSV